MLNIVLTGGPSSGKTTILNALNEKFTEYGYNVIIVPETATELINSGIKPFGDNALSPIEFQKIVLKKQLNKEMLAQEAANIMGSDKTIIVYDRGTLDGYAYVLENEWDMVLNSLSLSQRGLLSRYDGILYLEGAEKFFTKENNKARYEKDAKEGIEKGKKVLKSYLSHDSLRVIQPRENMEDKKTEVINVISNMLGKPTRIREQKKYLVADLDVEKISTIANKVVITQDYLKVFDDIEYRVRKKEQNGFSSYHYSIIKKEKNGIREIIKEETISKETYESLLSTKNTDSESIVKTRYSFVENQQYFKLDVFLDDLVLLEVNLTKENPNISIPEFIIPEKDVTNDEEYSNKNIARRMMTTYEKRKNNSNRGNRLFR